jgi:hypothetical protein
MRGVDYQRHSSFHGRTVLGVFGFEGNIEEREIKE